MYFSIAKAGYFCEYRAFSERHNYTNLRKRRRGIKARLRAIFRCTLSDGNNSVCALCINSAALFVHFAMFKTLLKLWEIWYNSGKGVLPMRRYDRAQLIACILVLVAELILCALVSAVAVVAYELLKGVF